MVAIMVTRLLILVLITLFGGVECDQLVTDFYSKSCPQAESVVRYVVTMAVQEEARMAASLLRLHFHDCFVQGCDASILLDDTNTFKGEKTAVPNLNSIRGLDVVDQIKAAVEAECPHTVSCADILAIAARDSVVVTGGPSWQVLLGRRDSTTASLSGANKNIPPPNSTVSGLVQAFLAFGLSVADMVALSGAHTIGQARCTSFSARLVNQSSSNLHMRSAFATQLKAVCPQGGNGNVTIPLDQVSSTFFDNQYFKNLRKAEGLLNSDQVLFSSSGSTKEIVNQFSSNKEHFFESFKVAMIKMGNITPLVGNNGAIRTNCRIVS